MSSPVALFVYDRLDTTRATMQALFANTLASDTDLYVFSDGGRDEASWRRVNHVRDYLHSVYLREVGEQHLLRSMTIIERPRNIYLEQNIIQGVSYVLQRHDTIIVLEDDIVTSPYFLQYMDEAFSLYRDVPRVMHVAGFTHLDLMKPDSETQTPYYFTPHMSGWGWGTWRDRWERHFVHYQSRSEAMDGLDASDADRMQYGGVFPCLQHLDRSPIPWDVCWEIAIYRAHGLCLTPGHTLVRNVGLHRGTHFLAFDILQRYEYDRPPLSHPLLLQRCENPQADPVIEAAFANAIRDWGIRYTLLGKVVRCFYLFLKPKK
uniref:Glycosyltransferase 2-like domain-containing protein n=1 Tax=uncultured bacterium fosmid pJB135F11 TaxID=1478051 RepID=A0A0H3U8B1_9BACT|nr:hypothetical protein [uncultured bacterium fosmid pJB135F11]